MKFLIVVMLVCLLSGQAMANEIFDQAINTWYADEMAVKRGYPRTIKIERFSKAEIQGLKCSWRKNNKTYRVECEGMQPFNFDLESRIYEANYLKADFGDYHIGCSPHEIAEFIIKNKDIPTESQKKKICNTRMKFFAKYYTKELLGIMESNKNKPILKKWGNQ